MTSPDQAIGKISGESALTWVANRSKNAAPVQMAGVAPGWWLAVSPGEHVPLVRDDPAWQTRQFSA